LVTKWSDCSVVKICYADVHLLRSLQKIIRGNVGYVAMVMRDVDLQEHIHPTLDTVFCRLLRQNPQ